MNNESKGMNNESKGIPIAYGKSEEVIDVML